MEKYKNVAFIPARGGSKSIKLKNIKEINGRPMIYWVLDSAVRCDSIDVVFVSTDSTEIAEAVREYNNDKVTIIDRSAETATDDAPTEWAMLEFAHKFEFENIILIQATSPMMESEYLSEGISMIESGSYDSVLSATVQKKFIWMKDEKSASPVNYSPDKRLMRQDFEGYYAENGSFYITKRETLIKTGCRLNGDIGIVVMPEYTYFEIDEPHDIKIVEGLMQMKNRSDDLKKIKAVFTDCDGVLTDGGMYYTESGDEFKRFNAKDGMGFRLLRQHNIITGIITGENSKIVMRRAEKLCVDELHMSAADKLAVLEGILKKYGLDYAEVLYIGDDVNDLSVLQAVGYPACVSDAVDAVKNICSYVSKLPGGSGAVREIIDMVIKGYDN